MRARLGVFKEGVLVEGVRVCLVDGERVWVELGLEPMKG